MHSMNQMQQFKTRYMKGIFYGIIRSDMKIICHIPTTEIKLFAPFLLFSEE
jgi:hypothetical protein